MSFDLPALYHGCVYSETVYGPHEEDGEREEGYAVDEYEDEEVGHGPDGRAEVGGEIAVFPEYEDAGEEVVG